MQTSVFPCVHYFKRIRYRGTGVCVIHLSDTSPKLMPDVLTEYSKSRNKERIRTVSTYCKDSNLNYEAEVNAAESTMGSICQ